jgi:hypothetical protein
MMTPGLASLALLATAVMQALAAWRSGDAGSLPWTLAFVAGSLVAAGAALHAHDEAMGWCIAHPRPGPASSPHIAAAAARAQLDLAWRDIDAACCLTASTRGAEHDPATCRDHIRRTHTGRQGPE